MHFVSDNTAPADPAILEAISRVNSANEASYGDDASTKRINFALSKIFEREVLAFPVISGTAANALAISTLTPPHGAVFCHEAAHINTDECAAVEFFSGAKLVPVSGNNGKICPQNLTAAIEKNPRGSVHSVQPACISVTQATELGTAYSSDELSELSRIAQIHKLYIHMDGARFANAVANSKQTPAECTWKSGVDVLSFGFTKNGAMAAETVIFFNPDLARDFVFRRKRGGHLISKMRFVSTQIEAMLSEGLWLKLARHANDMARRLEAHLKSTAGAKLEFPVEANEVFVRLPDHKTRKRLEQVGAKFYTWSPMSDPHPLIRLVCSHVTTPEEVDRFCEAVRLAH